jgi:copper transport protein
VSARVLRRLVRASLLAAGMLVVTAGPASAHAALETSEPADGTTLETAPSAITMSFTEPPDLELSTVTVLDPSGAELETGTLEDGPAPRSLSVPLPAGLGEGAYTVSWRVISLADGHPTAGAFVFGIGVDPGHAPIPETHAEPEQQTIVPLAVAGKTLLYAGLVIVAGAAAIGLGVLGGHVPSRRWLLPIGGVLAIVGAIVMTVAEADTIGTTIGALLRSDTGRAYIWLLATAFLTLVLGIAAGRTPARPALALAGLAAASAMLVRATSGHAAGISPALPAEMAQFVHFAAIGVWIGGLAVVLLMLRERSRAIAERATEADPIDAPPAEVDLRSVPRILPLPRSRARDGWGFRGDEGPPTTEVAAFSRIAGWAVLVVVLTGLIRTIGEAGGLDGVVELLTDTTFGTALIVKVAIAIAIVGLGAFNRWRSIPRMRSGDSSLRRVIDVEMAAAVGVFGVTAALTGFNPDLPSEHATEDTMATSIAASGSDFATTTRVDLTIEPGVPGSNTFEAHVVDYDDGTPIDADEVTLLLTPLGRPEIEPTSLALASQGDGMWTASGTELSLAGPWNTLVQVRVGTTTTEVPMIVVTRAEPVEPTLTRGPPDIAAFALPTGEQLQVYLDPGVAGSNELHVTAFDADGVELPLSAVVVVASMHDGEPEVLDTTQITPGHFSAAAELESGAWRFDVTGITDEGAALQVSYELQVPA